MKGLPQFRLSGRWRVLAPLALLVVAAAALLASGDLPEWMLPASETPVSEAVPARPRPPATAAAPADGEGAGGTGGGNGDAAPKAVVDIFAVRTWEPPPPPPDLSPPPPPPPPPLPFKYLGRVVEPGKKVAFMLADDKRVFVVGVGDAIGSDYRIESFENEQLVLRYRPMNVRQSIDVGSNS